VTGEEPRNEVERRIVEAVREGDIDALLAEYEAAGLTMTREELLAKMETEALRRYRLMRTVTEIPEMFRFEGERADAQIRFFQILVPHMDIERSKALSPADSWKETLSRLSEEEMAEVQAILGGRTLDEFLA
jgi:hypothetical protein